MRKLFIIATMALCQSTFATTAADNDTIIVNKPNKVMVVTSDSLQSIVIEGSENNSHFRYTNTIQLVDSNYVSTAAINDDTWEFSLNPFKKSTGNGSSANGKSSKRVKGELVMKFGAGFCMAPGAPDAMDVRAFKSWELWWLVAEARFHPWRNNHILSAGIGLDWRNYRITDEYRFVPDGKNVNLEAYPEGAKPDFSRIKVFSVNFPLRYQYRTKNAGFSFGPVVNLNVHSSTKTRYTLNGGKYKDTAGDVRVTPVTVDFMGTVNVKWLEMYVKYSPCSVLEDGHGPKFKSLSFGFML